MGDGIVNGKRGGYLKSDEALVNILGVVCMNENKSILINDKNLLNFLRI